MIIVVKKRKNLPKNCIKLLKIEKKLLKIEKRDVKNVLDVVKKYCN